jgi:hypothetical protein
MGVFSLESSQIHLLLSCQVADRDSAEDVATIFEFSSVLSGLAMGQVMESVHHQTIIIFAFSIPLIQISHHR